MRILLALVLLVSACEYDENDLAETGSYLCTSSQGRAEYRFDSSTLKITQLGLNEFIAQFREEGTGNVIRLHSVEDRDYSCGPIKSDNPA